MPRHVLPTQHFPHTAPILLGIIAATVGSRRLRVRYDIARAMNRFDDIDSRMTRILAAILDVFGCERGVIGLMEPGGAPGSLRRVTRCRGAITPGEVVISRAILE